MYNLHISYINIIYPDYDILADVRRTLYVVQCTTYDC